MILVSVLILLGFDSVASSIIERLVLLVVVLIVFVVVIFGGGCRLFLVSFTLVLGKAPAFIDLFNLGLVVVLFDVDVVAVDASMTACFLLSS